LQLRRDIIFATAGRLKFTGCQIEGEQRAGQATILKC
jgi:hypothetical protein